MLAPAEQDVQLLWGLAYGNALLFLDVQATRTRASYTTASEEGPGSVSRLNAVVELMLDITESSVAFCWELGAGKLDTSKFCNLLHRPVLRA